ncbi:MAG: putative lipid II flippase FtsW [Gammaproteobacteria bacterium]
MNQRPHMCIERTPAQKALRIVLYDHYLIFAVMALLSLSLLMIYSTSMVISERSHGQPYYHLMRQAAHLLVGIIAAIIVMRIELDTWQKYSAYLLLSILGLLILVLIPGIGREVNGSMRWIGVSVIGVQVSEFAKLISILFLSAYVVRREKEFKTTFIGFIKPMGILAFLCALILKEPDFGAAVVIMMTALGIMFLAGVRLWQLGLLLGLVGTAMGILAVSSAYRLARLTTFLNPWANPFDSGYQLTQSLIAFGRGGWFGVGLGESVQKLFYLPESHTDFLLAVIAEELGLVGVLCILALFSLLVARALMMGRQSYLQGRYFSAYSAYGIGLWIAVQSMINVGVNMGVLPTKGLTLPLMSYGGSSLLVMCIAIGILFRIDYEARLISRGLRQLKNNRRF